MPRLNLVDDLGLRDDDENSHSIKQVEESGDISWGTPLSTAKNSAKKTTIRTAKPVTSPIVQTSPKKPTEPKPKPEKYYYLNKSARPLGELTGWDLISIHFF